MLAGPDQHHGHRHVRFGQTRGAEADEGAELLEAVFLAAVLEQRRVLAEVPRHDVARQAHDAFHGCQRQRIHLLGDAHDERLADGERERQTNREARALAEVDSMNKPPPSFLTSVATTSMPTPRPAAWVTRPAVLKPGSRISCIASSSVSFDWRSVRPSATAFSRINFTLMPPPSSATTITTSAPSRVRLTEIRPTSGLPSAARRSGASMPCTTALRSMCSSGGDHALQHLAIEFRGRALHDEFGALAGVVGGLPDETRQALHMALKRHHARAHQAVLQFGDGACLLRQQVLRLAGQRLEQPLNARDVARGLGERP